MSLKLRFALLIIAILAVSGGFNLIYLEYRLLGEMEHESEVKALYLAKHLASDSSQLILNHEAAVLRAFLYEALRFDPDLAYCFVVDPHGRVVAHTFNGNFPRTLLTYNKLKPGAEQQVKIIDLFSGRYRDFAVPIDGGELGTFRLGVRDSAVLEKLNHIRREMGLLILVVMVLGAVIAYVLAGLLLKPFKRISETLERFEPGKHREEIDIRRGDEIGELARKVDEVTARLHETHQNLMRSERLAAIGTMAAGIAHEINNPITGIRNCLQRIQARPGDERQTREYAEIMLKSTAHMERIVMGLLDFARSTPLKMRELDLRRVVERALDMIEHRLEGSRIELVRRLSGQEVLVRGDQDQLVQVAVNLLLNALDAMPGGGRLIIDLRAAGKKAVLRISDTGVGIPEENRERIFDPFFTTKEVGRGTGLGMAVTHRIVTEHEGEIGIDSAKGKGTVVWVMLPLWVTQKEEV